MMAAVFYLTSSMRFSGADIVLHEECTKTAAKIVHRML